MEVQTNHIPPALAATESSGAQESSRRSGAATFARVLEVGAGVARAVVPGASALPGGDGRLDRMWEMQAQSQGFQMEMIALQTAIQQDSQYFTTLSNVIRARHDTARAAISNIRS